MSAPTTWAIIEAEKAMVAGDRLVGVYPQSGPIRQVHRDSIACAIDSARAEGFRAGIEAAAKVCDAHQYAAGALLNTYTTDDRDRLGVAKQTGKWQAANDCADEIRKLTPEKT